MLFWFVKVFLSYFDDYNYRAAWPRGINSGICIEIDILIFQSEIWDNFRKEEKPRVGPLLKETKHHLVLFSLLLKQTKWHLVLALPN